MSATAVKPRFDPDVPMRDAPWPRLAVCRCGALVVRARGPRQGHPLTLDARELLPSGRCQRCKGRGTCSLLVHAGTADGKRGAGRRTSVEPGDLVGRTTRAQDQVCPDCHGTGIVGQSIPDDTVILDALTGVAHRSQLCDPTGRAPAVRLRATRGSPVPQARHAAGGGVSTGRYVDTVYGPMPGCPDCGVIVMAGGPHICEHGVTPAPVLEASFTITVDAATFDVLLGGEAA